MNIDNNNGTSLDFADVIARINEQAGYNSHGEQFDIVSRVAYLLGINKKFFENEYEPVKAEIYRKLEKDKKARIIRNLCILRTQLEHNFLKVCHGIQQEGRSIMGMPEYMPIAAMQSLYDDGIEIYVHLKEPTPYLINLNKNIKSRINNCRDLFPQWINWDYLSDIFIMPDGLTEEGTKRAAAFYYENMNYYPYKQYLNWPASDEGNILLNDRKFVTLLYRWNNDEFQNLSLVSDVSDRTKANIYTYIENSDKCVFIVDCENSDPYSLCAAIRNLDPERLEKIEKIILFDDIHAASAWEILSSYVSIPVEYIMIERLKDNKSLADVKVAARTCREYYTNNVDSFVLVSSDSDYWGLMEELPEARFLVMVEHDKVSYALKETLIKNDIFYCYIDSFYAGGADDIKTDAIQKELARSIKASLDLNLNSLMNEVLNRTRIEMTDEEVKSFIKRKIKNQLEIDIADDGEVSLNYRVRK
ncbi:NYN domain-containing protein [Butyrivibrio sp. MC2013]|uniref:NYN domain-containing protein n=1 Tax=Butyrivibrio sp. MC2013 TaxID=1280686 RepID=UPI00040A7B96|nr:NYN domain-containing protein [Butyrivibrio sp. MC2013]